jgi:hypothetical protein
VSRRRMRDPIERGRGHDRAELQAWYLGSLQPKLAVAASAGTVAPVPAATLDRLLRALLDLPDAGVRQAA